MPVRMTVLASGSSGNACLLEVDSCGVLVDLGLGPRTIASRLAQAGTTWQRVQAVLLTHTHGDHWNERSLNTLAARNIRLFCHAEHRDKLAKSSPAMGRLQWARLVRTYEVGEIGGLPSGLACTAFEVPHDGGPTFGFRFDGAADLLQPAWSLAYVADLGTWDDQLVAHLADVDVLALEFNHDVPLQRQSRRAPALIARVLSDLGHLSNEQAADLLAAVIRRSRRPLKHLVQLHLSQQCNLPELAAAAARRVLDPLPQEVGLHTARQGSPLPTLEWDETPDVTRPSCELPGRASR